MKRLFSILTVLCLLCTGALAEGAVWDFDTDNLILRGYEGPGGEVVVPDVLEGWDVLGIGQGAFSSVEGMTALSMPAAVLSLGSGVGGWNKSLERVALPDSLLVVEGGCFASCDALESVTIPAAVCYIGDGAFSFCRSLETVTFEGPCPVFDGTAFVNLADGAKILVPEDELDAYKAAFAAMDFAPEVLSTGRQAVRPGPMRDDASLDFDAATGTITLYRGFNIRLDIPETLNGVPVKAIGPNAFKGNRYLSFLTLPEGLETIGDDAFADALTLLHVEFPSTLKTIGNRAFNRSYKASRLNLPEGVVSIGEEAFVYSGLSGELVLPEGLEHIGARAFNGHWLTRVILPSTLKTIGENAFAKPDDTMNDIRYVLFTGEELPEIDPKAFADCKKLADIDIYWKGSKEDMLALQKMVDDLGLSCRVWRNQNPNVDYPNEGDWTYENGVWTAYEGPQTHIRPWDSYNDITVTAIGDGLFKDSTTLQYFAVPYSDAFTTIGREAFAGSSVETVDLFDSVTTIGEGAFRDCVHIKTMTIPASVTEIGADAFAGCTGLESVNLLCDLSILPENAFAGCSALRDVQIASASAIPAGCFAGTAIAEMSIPDTVKEIGSGAFKGCAQLKHAELPDTLETLGAQAFAGCAQLEDVVIPASLTALNADVFADVPLTEIRAADAASDEQLAAWEAQLAFPWYDRLVRESEPAQFAKMPDAASPEEDFAFDAETGDITAYLGNAETVVVPRSIGGVPVTGIAFTAFERARDYTDTGMGDKKTETVIRTLVLPETVVRLSEGAFSYMQGLESFTCYGPLETSAKGAFRLCRGLKHVNYMNGVRLLDSYTFESCSLLETVYTGEHLDRIAENAFFQSGPKQMVVDAETVDFRAFWQSEQLEEVHFTSRVKTLSAGALSACPNLKTVCLEMDMLDGMSRDGVVVEGPKALTVILPEAADDKQAEAAKYICMWGSETEITVKKADCAREAEKPVLPEAVRLEETEKTEKTEEPEVPEQEPAPSDKLEASGKEETAPAATNDYTGRLEVKYVCVTAVVDGCELEAAKLGPEYSAVFHKDGTVELSLAGTAMPILPWVQEETDAGLVWNIDYYGTPMIFTLTNEGFDFNYYDSMLMHFKQAQ